LISSTALISATLEEEVWKALRAKFQYILIDCPALDSGSQILSLGGQIDGTVLVVRAGFGQKREIQQAVRLLCGGPARLLGLVLNRRTFPIPRRLFRFL
jgi:protein-tyrosine kinase